MATIRRDHYSLLGVPRTAEASEIRRAFKQRAMERHPDHAGAQATGDFRELSDAYRVLADPSRRAAYDVELSRRESRPSGTVLDLRKGPHRDGRAPAPDGAPVAPLFGDLHAGSDLFEFLFDRLFRNHVDWGLPEPEDPEEPIDVLAFFRGGRRRW